VPNSPFSSQPWNYTNNADGRIVNVMGFTMKYFVFLVAILAVVTGCSAASGSTPAIHPASEIIASGPTFGGDSTANLTFELQTKIPVACSVVYGETTAYGNIATDTDMAGGAHSEHHPLLTGLKPDTIYHFRFQGSDANGTLYVSDDLTYRTPKATASTTASNQPAGKNVALLSEGASIKGVSSNYGGGDNASAYGANHAIDGDPSSQWSSNGDGDKAWIEIELPQETKLSALGFQTRTMGSSAQISQFQVVTDKGETLGPFDLPDASAVHYFPVDTTARTLRFEVLKSSGGNTGATEIEVYAAP